jgi:hypothetical protein
VAQALQRLCLSGEFAPQWSEITQLVGYVEGIMAELAEFAKSKEDCIIFGRQIEMMDLRHNDDGGRLDMRVVPVTREEFKI